MKDESGGSHCDGWDIAQPDDKKDTLLCEYRQPWFSGESHSDLNIRKHGMHGNVTGRTCRLLGSLKLHVLIRFKNWEVRVEHGSGCEAGSKWCFCNKWEYEKGNIFP